MKRLQNICASQIESEGSEDEGSAIEGQESSSAAIPVCQQSQADSTQESQESEVLPDGPLSSARFLQKLLDMEACDLVQANLKSLKSVVLTTSFSGVGSPEVALSMIARHLEEMGGIWDSDTVQVCSACEKDAPCQGVLTSHVGTCRPEHVFVDIAHMLPHASEQELRDLSSSLRKQLASMIENGHGKPETVRVLAEQFHLRAEHVLDHAKVQSQAYCAVHRCPCPCMPKQSEGGFRLHIEVAGSPCVAFVKGAYGSQEGFLHESAVGFVAWVAKVRHQKPHVVVHECVPGFDEQILCRYLNAGYASWSPLYEVQSVVWNVLHEGFPVSRDRRYTICVLAQYECSSVFRLESCWHDLVNAERRLSADVYLQASESDLDMIREDWACSRSLPAKRRTSRGLANWAWEALMLPSSRKVLHALRLDASEQEGLWLADLGAAEADVRARASAPDGRPLFRWLVNLSQSSTFQPRLMPLHVGHMPTLLRSSRFFIDSSLPEYQRPVHPFEVFCMQGLPMYLPETHPALQCCHMKEVLRRAMTQHGLKLRTP